MNLEKHELALPVKLRIKTNLIGKKTVVIKGGSKCDQGKQIQLQDETPDQKWSVKIAYGYQGLWTAKFISAWSSAPVWSTMTHH